MSILKAFTTHLLEFIDDVQRIFPDDHDVKVARNSIDAIRRVNPRKMIEFWRYYVAEPYRERIEASDITFFLEKEYGEDLQDANNQDTILQSIERLREPIRQMSSSNQEKAMKYIQNLTKLCLMY